MLYPIELRAQYPRSLPARWSLTETGKRLEGIRISVGCETVWSVLGVISPACRNRRPGLAGENFGVHPVGSAERSADQEGVPCSRDDHAENDRVNREPGDDAGGDERHEPQPVEPIPRSAPLVGGEADRQLGVSLVLLRSTDADQSPDLSTMLLVETVPRRHEAWIQFHRPAGIVQWLCSILFTWHRSFTFPSPPIASGWGVDRRSVRHGRWCGPAATFDGRATSLHLSAVTRLSWVPANSG